MLAGRWRTTLGRVTPGTRASLASRTARELATIGGDRGGASRALREAATCWARSAFAEEKADAKAC